MSKRTISIDGEAARYTLLNPHCSPTLLMVHGFRGNAGGLLQFAKHLTGFRIIIPDLPGHGDNPPIKKGKHDVDGYAAWVNSFAAAIGLERYVLIGHSFGALIAAKMAVGDAHSFSRLILLNPVSESNRYIAYAGMFYYQLGLALPDPIGSRLLRSRLINRLNTYLMIKTSNPQVQAEIYKHHLSDLEYPFYKKVITEAVDSALNKQVLDYASSITLPTLIVAGELDDLAPLPSQQRLHRLIPNSELSVIPGVGHLTHLETPQEMAEIVRLYLCASLELQNK